MMVAMDVWLFKLMLCSIVCVGNAIRPAKPPICKYLNNNTIADCSRKDGYQKWQYIPMLPCRVRRLNFNNNFLPVVMHATFSNLTCQKISTLLLSGNCIINISKTAFSSFQHLVNLELSGNGRLPVQQLANAMSSLSGAPVKNLIISNMGWKLFPNTIFAEGNYGMMKTLDLSFNEFVPFNDTAIKNLPHLNTLNLAKNQLQHMNLHGHPSLQHLNLYQNQLSAVPDFCLNGDITFPELVSVDLRRNRIKFLKHPSWNCLKNLSSLNLNENFLEYIRDNTFSSMTSLSVLKLQKNNIGYLDPHAFNNSNLQQLIMSNSMLYLKRVRALSVLFNSTRNLTDLDLSSTSFRGLQTSDMIAVFFPLNKLLKLRLVKCEISELPRGLFSSMPNLQSLDLTGNGIHSLQINPGIFHCLKNLTKMILKENKIHEIKKQTFPLHLRQSIKLIDLAHNPFSCDCSNVWFINWMKTNKNILKRFPKGYQCSTPKNLRGSYLVEYHPSSIACTITQPVLNVIIILTSFLILMAFAGILAYRFQWKIRYWIFLCRFRKNDYQRIPGREESVYDAILVYAEEDRPWVTDILAVYLEKKNYKFYISDRDCSPNEQEAAKWLTNFENSNKVIFVLSQHFLASDFCSYLTNVVIQSSVTRGNELLLPVFKQNTGLRKIKRNLLEILTRIHPPVWTDDEAGQELFWLKMINALGPPLQKTALFDE